MRVLVWSKIGVVLVLAIAVAIVLHFKQQHVIAPTGAPATPVAVKANLIPRLLDLGSVSCIPCKMMVPVMDELKKTYPGKLQVDFINVTEDPASAAKYGIETIPTQILFDASGKELYRHMGFYARDEIVAKFKELGIKL